jgi:extradiol dioxygenase family protein
MNRFHYAFKVKDIDSTIAFYQGILGCQLGRQTGHWIDFNFFGHQLSAHVSNKIPELDYCGKVDGVAVPIPHFGCLVSKDEFAGLKDRLISSGLQFIIEPQIRYAGLPAEQQTMFVLDYSNNPIEFKCFENDGEVFL